MLALNGGVFRHLERTGSGAAVLEAQGIPAAADGRLANVDAKLPAAAG